MRRREFITLIGGAVALWPFAASAQQVKVPTLGILVPGEKEPFFSTFEQGLRRLGYIPGRNIQIEYRSAEGQPGRLAPLAAELVALNVDILIGSMTPAAMAVKQASRTIPIVMYSGDPVAVGLVASLARPGANVTGLSATTADLSGKTLELIREVLPSARRVAVLANGTDPFTKHFLEQLQRGADTLGMELRPTMAVAVAEFESIFAEMVKWRADAVVVQPSLPRRPIVELTLRHGLASVSPSRAYALDGGLMSYSSQSEDGFRELAIYVDKILKGSKPADLPVQQPTKFVLAVNLKTAKALGLTIPPSLLARADDVIE
jgi:putative ABC transport system substrate-binding protein